MSTPIRRDWGGNAPPVQRRELMAWALYDFANSGYTTVVITAVFNAYFVSAIAGGADWATLAWTGTLSVSYAVVMLGGPLLGAWADLRAMKKPLLAGTTALCVLATAGLSLCGPGDLALAVLLVMLSNLAFAAGENLIAAFLPELARPEAMGRLSGYGWSFGYLGGLLVLGLCLVWIQGAAARGDTVGLAVRHSMLLTAAMFAVAALPTLLLLKERALPQTTSLASARALAAARVRGALSGSDGLRDLRRFLVCIVCYNAGVGTVVTVAAIYTQQALGFDTADSIKLILVVNVAAAAGALVFGWVQDRLGHRATLALTLVGWLVALAVLWASDSHTGVWVAANIAGLCLGASQSAGRALVGWLCPPAREAEIFGLWGMAVKLSMILGPLGYGLASWLSGGNHRAAMLGTGLYFIGGLLLLARVDVQRGRAAALSAAPTGAAVIAG